LGVKTSGGAAEKASEGRGQDEVVYVVALHEDFLSSVWNGICAAGNWLLPAAVGSEECGRILMSTHTVPNV
jgi:hypothetical protein